MDLEKSDPACAHPEDVTAAFLGQKSKNSSRPPSFEQHFHDPRVHRTFYINILSVQLFTSFLCFLVAFACTIVSNQQKFLANLDEALGPIVVNVFILLLVGGTFTLLRSRYPGFNHPTWFLHKTLVETLLRMYQAGLVTFATAFLCEKLFRLQNNGEVIIFDGTEIQLESPFYFSVCFIYGLNLSLYLSLIIWLRYKSNAKIDALAVHVFSLTRISVCLLVAVPSIFIARSRSPMWNIAQIFLASIWAILDGLILVCTLKLGTGMKSKEPADFAAVV